MKWSPASLRSQQQQVRSDSCWAHEEPSLLNAQAQAKMENMELKSLDSKCQTERTQLGNLQQAKLTSAIRKEKLEPQDCQKKYHLSEGSIAICRGPMMRGETLGSICTPKWSHGSEFDCPWGKETGGCPTGAHQLSSFHDVRGTCGSYFGGCVDPQIPQNRQSAPRSDSHTCQHHLNKTVKIETGLSENGGNLWQTKNHLKSFQAQNHAYHWKCLPPISIAVPLCHSK